jgi:hypothetical protein
VHELFELLCIESPIRAKAAADVDPKWLHLSYRFADIERVQSAGQINGHLHGVANSPAHRPIVRAASPTQLFRRERWIPGIEKKRVHLR